jgi:hypothetical protein
VIVATHRGIRFLAATLAPDNIPSRKLIAGIGAQFRFVDGLLLADARLPHLPRTTMDRSAVIGLPRQATTAPTVTATTADAAVTNPFPEPIPMIFETNSAANPPIPACRRIWCSTPMAWP